MTAKIRLYLDQPLSKGQSASLSRDQAHYLSGVMRLGPGDEVLGFNGRDGEYLCRIETAGKRGGILTIGERTRAPTTPPDLWLLFSPVKKVQTNFIVEKAVEMGAARICPVRTDHTNSERIRRDRMEAHVLEAAEQCGAVHLPEVDDLVTLDAMLKNWDADRRLMFCDETLAGQAEPLAEASRGPWAILIGPEGGFSEAERARLAALSFVHPVSLGPRILRAETAAVAALALWQASLGDWV